MSSSEGFKAMNEVDHVTSVITVTLCIVIQTLTTKIDF